MKMSGHRIVHHVLLQNVNTAAFHLTLSTSRWFAVMIDWFVTAFIAIVAFFCVWMGHGSFALNSLPVIFTDRTDHWGWRKRELKSAKTNSRVPDLNQRPMDIFVYSTVHRSTN
jgi:hypothetical protein